MRFRHYKEKSLDFLDQGYNDKQFSRSLGMARVPIFVQHLCLLMCKCVILIEQNTQPTLNIRLYYSDPYSFRKKVTICLLFIHKP